MHSLKQKLAAEFFGTFWLVFGGCGSAVLAAAFIARPDAVAVNLGIGFVGVAVAFGLTVMTMAFAIGHISGCHLNPAVSLGLLVAGRFPAKDFVPYVLVQCLGATAGAGVLLGVAGGNANFVIAQEAAGAFATNGFGDFSPGKYNLMSCAIIETLLTFFFLMIILGSTDKRAPAGLAPVAIGLGLTLIHLISIPVTNTSVNPARSVGPAVFVGGEQLKQVWLFWAAPLAGAVLAGIVYPLMAGKPSVKDEG